MQNLNAYQIISIFNFLSPFLLGVFILKGSKKKDTTIWAILCLDISFWGLGGLIASTALTKNVAYIGWQIANICSILVSPIFYHFTCEYLTLKRKMSNLFAYSVASFFLFLNLFYKEAFLGELQFVFNQYYYISFNININLAYLILYIGFYWILLIYSFSLLVRAYFRADKLKRNHLGYISLGSGLGWLGAHSDFLSVFKPDIYPYLNFLIGVFPVVISFGVVRYQLLDVQVVVKKSLIYSCLITLLSLVYTLMVVLSEYIFRGKIGYSSVYLSGFIALSVAIIAIPLKNKLQNIIDRLFYKGTPEEISQENDLLWSQLALAEKQKIAAMMAGSIAHEIRNPLTSLKTFTEYLPKKLDDKEFLRKFSLIATDEINRIDQLSQNLLDFAKPSPLKIKTVDLHRLLHDMVDLLGNEKSKRHIHILEEFHPDPITVQVDPTQFKQAIINLLLNGIEAMENGGTLRLKTIMTKFFVEILISDKGNGISSQDLRQIFVPFFTKKESGTGLGLSITQRIILEHRGEISVQSLLGKGTTFTIKLPYVYASNK